MKYLSKYLALICGGLFLAGCQNFGNNAQSVNSQQELIDRTTNMVASLQQDPDFPQIEAYLERARAVFLIPRLIKGGLFVGGEGGNGVLLMRLPDGSWGPPAFYRLSAGSIGLQFGGQVSEMALTIMTLEGLEAILRGDVTLGADVNAAFAVVGVGAEIRSPLSPNADMYAFTRNRGLYIGGSLDGTLIQNMADWDRGYYGAGAHAEAILGGLFDQPGTAALRAALP